MKKVKNNTVLKYAVYFVLLVLLTRAETAHGFMPFGLGFFAALVFARQNLIVLAPMFIAASLIADFSVTSAIFAAVPAFVLMLAYWIHHKLDKPISLTFANLYVALSQVPRIVYQSFHNQLFDIFLSAAITQIFAYCAIVAMYAVLVRGLRFRLTVDEAASGAVVAAALFLGLYQCSFWDFNLYFPFLAVTLLLCSYLFAPSVPLAVAAIAGFGASLSAGNLQLAAAAVIWACVIVLFKNTSVLVSALSVIVADLALGFYFEVYSGYGYLNVAAVAVGVAVYLIIPRSFKRALYGHFGDIKEGNAGKTIVNRNKLDVSNRLFSIATVFEDMQDLLSERVGGEPPESETRAQIAKNVAVNFCAVCPDCDRCFSSLGGDTSQIVSDILETAQGKGKATIIDMPPFITSRCRRVNGLITAINENIESHRNYRKLTKSLDQGKLMLAKQMGGMAEILDNLGHDIKRCVSFDTTREKLIIDELIYHNIVCREAAVYGADGDLSVALIVRASDAEKQILPKIVSKVIKARLIRDGAPDYMGDSASVHLIVAPRYDIVYGEAFRCRAGESVCGDCRSIQKIGEKKVVLAVCDGMGSGESAEKQAVDSIAMVENFYRAGFNNEVALELVNRLLSLKNDENFSALDMCVLDLNSGGADFVKLGVPASYIKRKERVEIIEGHSLPMGILEEVSPSTERKILFSGDMVLIMSDGVADALLQAEIFELLENHKSGNPQQLADAIIDAAASRGVSDDMTVLAVKIYSAP